MQHFSFGLGCGKHNNMSRSKTEDRAGQRRCSKCGEWKPRTPENFRKVSTCRFGLSGICKICANKYGREWKRGNKAYAERRRKNYRQSERVKENQRERKRWLASPERKRAQVLRMGMRSRSRQLGLDWDSDFFTVRYLADRLHNHPYCECCNRRLDVGRKFNRQKNDASPSIDRIIPNLGYIQYNVAILCWRCNNLKRDATYNELETVASWLKKKTRSTTRRHAAQLSLLD